MVEVKYSEGGVERLDEVEGLWLQLNHHHLERSVHFRHQYEHKTFASRKEEMFAKTGRGEMRVFLALSSDRIVPVAYCVGLVDDCMMGEVESIYVRPEFRGKGIGRELMRRSLAWMESRSVVRKMVEVAWDNQEAFGFYEKFGLFPRRVILEQSEWK
jgi:ribosomal protein S18 acetylase RimI-like enzyme